MSKTKLNWQKTYPDCFSKLLGICRIHKRYLYCGRYGVDSFYESNSEEGSLKILFEALQKVIVVKKSSGETLYL
jgi:hypothetical protein